MPTRPGSRGRSGSSSPVRVSWRRISRIAAQPYAAHAAPRPAARARVSSARLATASAATPSPRPTKPIPSPVVALTFTRAVRDAERGGERCAHRRACAAPSFGRSMHDRRVDVDDRAARARRAARRRARSSASESAPRQRSSVSGKCSPMSPRPAAPSSASITAWVSTSASEWPGEAQLARDRHAAEDQRPARREPVRVVADRRRASLGSRIRRPRSAPAAARGARTRRARCTPGSREQLERRVVAEAEVLGRWASLESATGQPGVEAHLEERAAPGRARRPACAGRRSRPRSRRPTRRSPSIASS